MDIQVLQDCQQLALEGKMTFPETIQRMAAIGVERYRADLVRMEKTHYAASGEMHAEPMVLTGLPAIAADLNQAQVEEAIVAIQQNKIQYAEFLRDIMAAGVTDYGVWLRGKKAIYFGRTGDFHIENFPAREQ